MTLFESIFILLFLGSVISVLLSPLLRKNISTRAILLTLASVWSVYLLILGVTDILSSQKVFTVVQAQS
jgi:uncharacterized membrane protein